VQPASPRAEAVFCAEFGSKVVPVTATYPTTGETFLELIQRGGVVESGELAACVKQFRDSGQWSDDPKTIADLLIRDSRLTYFQAEQLLQGRHRGFAMGPYRLLERLGAGGMGSVFLADHTATHELVALKVLPRNNAGKPTVTERFQREARAAVALKHPNVVRVYSIEQDQDIHFLVMEYVEGQDLRALISRRGALEPKRAAHYIRQAADGLQHVHDAGLIHRDVKPANLLLNRAGAIKLLDLGLARFVEDDDELTRRQGEGTVLGTADYLSPEQALDSHEVDQRTDIYSLGATFYYLLTGIAPVPAVPVPQKLICIQTQPPIPIRNLSPEVPAELAAVVDRMMAKNPGQRIQTPREVARALEPWTRTPVPPPAEEPPIRLSPLARAKAGLEKRSHGSQQGLARLWEPLFGSRSGNSSSDTFSKLSSTETMRNTKAPAPPPPEAGPTLGKYLPVVAMSALLGLLLVLLGWLLSR
jgi:serine/threonine protein kinase